MTSKEDIQFQVEEWVKSNIGAKFTFREHQEEAIVDIIYNILEDKNHTQIIEAPTGSGKSLMNIISAMVLADYYDKESYILVSDLYLWKQYEDFVNTHSIIRQKLGMLKGQTGNYKCEKNGQDMRNADCRMGGVSWASMFNPSSADDLGYACAMFCPYVKARKKAIRSKVVIMTYALYHYMINIVSRTMPEAKFSFHQKDIIFCDECHNIPSIMKLEFQPEIKLSDLNYFKTAYEYRCESKSELFEDNTLPDNEIDVISMHKSWDEINNRFMDIYNVAVNEHSTKPDDMQAVLKYNTLLHEFAKTIEQIESDLAYKKQVLHKKFNEDDIKFYKAASWFRNTGCFWSDFKMCIETVGIEYVIKLVNLNRNTNENVITYNVVKEDFISYTYLLKTAKHRVMMSATVGGYDAFAANAGIYYIEAAADYGEDEQILYNVIPSTFDFSKSPVHFLNRYKMSYAQKDASFPNVKQTIYNICKQFNDSKGMIQTGSYANAQEIYNDAPLEIKNRMLLYNGSKEKTTMITQHQMSMNTILVGPTLVEGIDLPGDDCRFIVIAKVPYPVIVDKYTKKKMELFPEWYNSTTSNTIIQGIGRGNRYKEDYCTTYILDACFLSLYNATKEQYPHELQERIKFYN